MATRLAHSPSQYSSAHGGAMMLSSNLETGRYDGLSQMQTVQTADSSAKRFAAGQKLQIELLEIQSLPDS